MRKRRVIICDADLDVLSTLSYFFTVRGEYDVLIYHEPSFCPVWSDTDCSALCADIIMIGLFTPGMSGTALFKAQPRRGCGIFTKNKALISTGIFDDRTMKDIVESDCVLFEKPLDLNKIAAWLNHCEKHMNLSRPLSIKRREMRYASDRPVEYLVRPNATVSKGISINASPSGLCLKTDTPLRYEQTVTLNPAAPDPSQVASVRWTNTLEEGSYIAGLQLL